MKRFLLLLVSAAALITSCTSTSTTRGVVFDPEYRYSNAQEIKITSIMFTDEETIVDMEINYTPGKWIRFNKSTYLIADNGERYAIQDVQGCNLGEKFIMPPSGRALFSVYFPPIEGSVKVLNYVEMDVARGWNVRGIQVDQLKQQ
ncbi:MAG: hypothetical protein J6L75_05385 [Alistipes sp.]|nr:hypothetical protein [Alistipes sp.]